MIGDKLQPETERIGEHLEINTPKRNEKKHFFLKYHWSLTIFHQIIICFMF